MNNQGKEKAKYFNIPIQLLEGFISNTNKTLTNIRDYALYVHCLKLTGTIDEKYDKACKWFNFEPSNKKDSKSNGYRLYEKIGKGSPMVGIKLSVFFEYRKNEKTEFNKVCFLAYHALKSIIGNKPYQKIENNFLWSRMDGNTLTIKSSEQLSPEVKFYSKEYQTRKIKQELQDNWGLIYYAQRTRGFYASFSMNLEQLMTEAIKRNRKYQNKTRTKELRLLEQKISAKIFNTYYPINQPINNSLN